MLGAGCWGHTDGRTQVRRFSTETRTNWRDSAPSRREASMPGPRQPPGAEGTRGPGPHPRRGGPARAGPRGGTPEPTPSSPPSTARDRPRPEVPPGHAEFGARRNPRTRLAGPGPPPALRCQGNRPRREPRASTLRGSSSVAPPGQRLRPAGRGSGGAPRG